MEKRRELTIYIPAYNEEANIKYLLESFLTQNIKSANLVEIIVESDNSIDKTVELSRSVKDSRIRVIDNKVRKGKSGLQNNIVKHINTDLLFIADADILPVGSHFLENLIIGILKKDNIALVCPKLTPFRPSENFLESMLSMSQDFKNYVYSRINNGSNVYMCVGGARLFKKKLYSSMVWDSSCPEDAFSYFECLNKGFDFAFVRESAVICKMPTTLLDHFKRSSRFFYGQKHLRRAYDKKFLSKHYRISPFIFLKGLLKFFLMHPIKLSVYSVLVIFVRLFLSNEVPNYSLWDISASTKRIIK